MNKLYKTDSNGKLRVLHIWTEGSEVIQESGLVDGKLSQRRSQCVGKNIGKNNETSPEQQAKLEAEAKYTKKLDEGYFLTKDEALSEIVILPTLAHEYSDHSDKINWSKPVYVQPKLDGMRCLGNALGMKSRKNKAIETMNHIQKDLDGIELYLDGELYAHGLSFQENMKLIKKYRPGKSELVKYHVYDLVDEDNEFSDRYQMLKVLISTMKNVKIVPTYEIKNEDELKKYHSKFLNEGYEGTIIRWGNEGYPINKRSQYLLKYKDFIDIKCEVIDIIASEKMPTQGVAVCKLDSGETFKCGMKFSHVEREGILKNKTHFIGHYAEIRFFEYTDDGLPRFPVCVGFRLD